MSQQDPPEVSPTRYGLIHGGAWHVVVGRFDKKTGGHVLSLCGHSGFAEFADELPAGRGCEACLRIRERAS